MSAADFVAGYLREIVRSGFSGLDVYKRSVSESDLTTALCDQLTSDLEPIWNRTITLNGRATTVGQAIESATGIPRLQRHGVPVSVSTQAGREFARARNGLRAFNIEEWGSDLSARLITAAQNAGPCRILATARNRITIQK
jgi:hypothetical protein